ncbi:DNA repair protein RecO [Patescibacteria group bacterium]|nr:DNA repair protein RecO [Patescibacteria group bacterium]MBU1721596.1 DNA repair protein RecO [Patescibacteria group bacterium]MBU1901822.1 DNA repair protein RecO [Patescibacteria group bacterium]
MDAIILKRKDIREYDQIVTCLTDHFGKQEYLIRGVKKIVSKNAAHIEPCSVVDMEFVSAKSGDMLTTVYTTQYFSHVKKDYIKRLVADMLLTLVDMCTTTGEDLTVYPLLLETLDILNTKRPLLDPVYFIDRFVLYLGKAVGISPVLEACCICKSNKKDDTEYILSIKQGGICCRSCVPLEGAIYPFCAEYRTILTMSTCNMSLRQQGLFHAYLHHHMSFHSPQSIPDWGNIKKWLNVADLCIIET